MRKSFTTKVGSVVRLGSGALLPAFLLAGCATTSATTDSEPAKPRYPATDVAAVSETQPVGTPNADAADDPAIWRNAANPAASLVLGTDKKAGLYVYGLDGKVRDFHAAGALNNVDLRTVRLADGKDAVLVGASDRTDRAAPRIALFWLDGGMAKLTALGAAPFLPTNHSPAEAYGFCMGGPLSPGELARAYVVLKDGEIAESRLIEREGRIAPVYVRSMKLATQSEGCVVDDASRMLFVAEEDVAIWSFALDSVQPTADRFASVGEADGLVDDIEGLAIARTEAKGILIASSQGDNAYVLFDIGNRKSMARFRIGGGAIDSTSDTDGIEIALGDFGPDYPEGIFVAQDGDNSPEAQNFKFLSWKDVRSKLGL